MEQPTNRKMLMLAVWSGPAMAVIFLLGWVVATADRSARGSGVAR
jgi:cytochrome bd-type quinol oxidase subunit 1